MYKSWRIATVAMVAMLAVALTGGAASATTLHASAGHFKSKGHHHELPTGAFGTVASVNGTATAGTCGVADTAGTFALNSVHNAVFTVDVSTSTTFAEHGMTTPSFVNVCVGGHVGALGTIASNTVTATTVFVIPPPTPNPQAVFGTVASVNGATAAGSCGVADTSGAFTLNGPHDAVFTVDVSTATNFAEHGVTTPSFVNVCVGERVGAIGMLSSGTVTATGVFVTPPPTPKPHAVFGTAASVNGATAAGTCGVADTSGAFMLNGPHDAVFTVDVSTTTTFAEDGVTTPTFVNVCVGGRVGAVGTVSSNTVTATGVFVASTPTPKPHIAFETPKGSFETPKGSDPHGSAPLAHPTAHISSDHNGFSGGPSNGSHFGHSSGHHSH